MRTLHGVAITLCLQEIIVDVVLSLVSFSPTVAGSELPLRDLIASPHQKRKLHGPMGQASLPNPPRSLARLAKSTARLRNTLEARRALRTRFQFSAQR